MFEIYMRLMVVIINWGQLKNKIIRYSFIKDLQTIIHDYCCSSSLFKSQTHYMPLKSHKTIDTFNQFCS